MTAKRSRRPTNKSSAITRRGLRRPGAPAAADLERKIFEAAFGMRESGSFGEACAGIVQSVIGAVAVVVSMRSGEHGQFQHAATSLVARDLASRDDAGSPLLKCLASGAACLSVVKQPKSRRSSAHDQAAAALGWHACYCVPLLDPFGVVVGAIAAYFPRKAAAKLKKSRIGIRLRTTLAAAFAARGTINTGATDTQQFNSLATTIPGVVYQRIVWPNGDIRYTYLSEGARELFGVEPEDVLRDPEVLFRTYSEDYKKTFRQRLIEASQNLTKWDVEASVELPDGRRRTTHAIARPERRADGSVLWTGVILDASRAKEAEDNLKAANRMVLSANQAKSAFLAKMSHEMRTPLNGVLGMGDLLLKTELTQRQTRLASTLCDSAKGLLGIINDVLDLSRIEAGHFKLDVQDFNLRHCVEDAVELCATSGYRKGLEVNLIIAPGTPIGVKSDPVRLRQVLINLIGNAIKFTQTGDVIIRLSSGAVIDGKVPVTVDVIDTGIGIDDKAIARLFEPFAQADSSISRRFGGTGLGLSITRHLVEHLGGTIELSSQHGVGTTARFVIPFEVTASAHTATILTQISLQNMRVLVIDDRASNREMMGANLVESGARIDFAATEDEALARLKEAAGSTDPYRVAVIDRIRPRSSSLHLCRTIRSCSQWQETAIVVLMSTNWNANPVDQHGLSNTVFLSKPARRSDLLAAIARSQKIEATAADGAKCLLAAAPGPRPAVPALKLRVLLVEDNPVNIEVAREYLSELECRVTVALNGIEALMAYDRSMFDVIMMDSQMPEMDGLTATRRIREIERTRNLLRIPIIAVTANAYDSDRAQALEAGSDDFLSKPFTDLQLRVMLQKWATAAPSSASSSGGDASSQSHQETAKTPVTSPEPVSGRLDEALHETLQRSRPAFLGKLLAAFLSSVPETLQALQAAVSEQNSELLRMTAHSLKSASANTGAKRLNELCRTLEVKLRLGADVADCQNLAAEVEHELLMARNELEKIADRLPQPAAPLRVMNR